MFHVHMCGQPEHLLLSILSAVFAMPEMLPMMEVQLQDLKGRCSSWAIWPKS